MSGWRFELELAKRTAVQTGAQLRSWQAAGVHPTDKKGRDLKIREDGQAEALILDALERESEYPVLTEESGVHGSIDTGSPFWIVDPLDGTLNFARGIPFTAVSIGLWMGDRPVLGVVYSLQPEELYYGVVGAGAWVGGVPISVSAVTETAEAVLATGFPVNRDFDSPSLLNFVGQLQRFKKVRLFGSAALSLAFLACGKVDAYFEEDIMLWDVAAGIALVQAAGGHAAVSGSPKSEWSRSVQCAAAHSILIPSAAGGPAE